MNTKRVAQLIVMTVASVSLITAGEKAPAAGDAKPLIDAMGAIGSIIAGAGGAVAAPDSQAVVEKDGQEAAAPGASEPGINKPRSAKNSVILVTGGAAAGAAIGAALGKDSKAAMIGAALGGAAGLIYDRMTYKNPGKI